jgi:hypothetical protein
MWDAFESSPESDRLMLHYRSFMEGDEGLAALSRLLDRPLVDRRSNRLMRSKGKSHLSFWLKETVHRLRTLQDVAGLDRRLRKVAASQRVVSA